MNRSEITEDSIALSKIYNSGASGSKKPHMAKQNDAKYMNAIRPYVKQRKISKRESNKNIVASIPIENKSKSKKNQSSSRKINDDSQSKNVGDIYAQLLTLKAEYKTLKNNYNNLAKQNIQLTERTQRDASEGENVRKQLQKVKKQNEKQQNNVRFLQEEIERIKKQCMRLLDSEKFKNKKLQETIQQKQLMIAYLRSQLAVLNGENPNTAFFFQHTAPTYTNTSSKNQHPSKSYINKEANSQLNALSKISVNQSAISSVPEPENYEEEINLPRQIPINKIANTEESGEKIRRPKRQYIFSNQDDSLSFSRDKSKQFDSIMSLSEPTILTFTKKDVYICGEGQNMDDFADEGTQSMTGEEELLTFQNRYGGNSKIVDSIPNTSKIRHNEEKRGSKNKLKHKKLQICTDEHGLNQQPKQSSSQTRKRYVHKHSKVQDTSHIKSGKQKKVRCKRKSQEGNTINMRK